MHVQKGRVKLRVDHISPALSPTYWIKGVIDTLVVTANTSRYYLYGGQQRPSRSSGRQADMIFIDSSHPCDIGIPQPPLTENVLHPFPSHLHMSLDVWLAFLTSPYNYLVSVYIQTIQPSRKRAG